MGAVVSNFHLVPFWVRTCSLETCCSGALRTKLGRHSGKTLHSCRPCCLPTLPCLYEHIYTHTHTALSHFLARHYCPHTSQLEPHAECIFGSYEVTETACLAS